MNSGFKIILKYVRTRGKGFLGFLPTIFSASLLRERNETEWNIWLPYGLSPKELSGSERP